MPWTDLLANKLAIENIFGTSLLLSDLEIFSIEFDLDRDSLFLNIRTGKLPEPLPKRWSANSSAVSFRLRAQLIRSVDVRYPVSGAEKMMEIRQGSTGIIIQAQLENTSIHVEASDLTVGEIKPF